MMENNCKLSIIQNELNIAKLHRVVKSFISFGKIKGNKGRECDGFIFITEGCCDYRFDDGTSFSVNEGDLMYLAKSAVYDMKVNSDKYSFIFCDFDFDSEFLRKSEVYHVKNAEQCKLAFDKLLYSFLSKRPGWNADCMALLYGVYVTAIKSVDYVSAFTRKLAYDAQNYILENIADPELSVVEVSKRVGISEVHLRRVFNGTFGLSPAKYIILTRIVRAKELMAESYLSIGDVSERCGFVSVPYFFRTFKSVTGKTPSVYRKSISL